MDLSFLKDKDYFSDCDILLLHTKTNWWKPNTWVSSRIQIDSGGKYNHSAMLVWSEEKKEWRIIEAKWQVEDNPLSIYCNDKYEFDIFQEKEPLTRYEQQDCEFKVREQIGDKYDVKAIAKIRLKQLFHSYKYIEELEPQIKDKNLWICSRLVLYGRQYCGRPILCEDGEPLGAIASPNDIGRSHSIEMTFSYR